jgi:phage terminase large subunit
VQRDFTFYGAAQEFVKYKGAEAVIHGPAETGKTISALWKLHLCALKYPNSSLVIARKVLSSTYSTVLQTFIKKVLIEEASWGIKSYGGEKAQWFDYSNGSRIWIAGLDKSSKILSAEHDVIYVNQAEEIELSDWETLITRTTGRAGNMPYAQTLGDANPGGSQHWILKRAGLELYKSLHVDNPVLYKDSELTEQGEITIVRLKSLTGVRRKRLYEGLWVTAEGAVYDMFDSQTHVITRPDSEMVRWYLAMDEGYTNPAVILLVGEDNDGRWHIAKEWYKTGKLQEQVVAEAAVLCRRYNVDLAAVDAAAAGLIAALINAGLPANSAKGRVLDGIWHIQDRLKIQDDGKPRLTVDPECLNTINEFESYIWEEGKDKPKKANDHAMDAIRYLDDIVGTPIWL